MTDTQTAERTIIDVDRILMPIPGDLPAGEDIRYEPEFDALVEARRMDDDTDKGIWQTDDVKRADWKGVAAGATDLLATRSKDLQIAVWLVQALVQQHGPSAIAPGLSMLAGLAETFWDGLYPRIDEDGDMEARFAPLSWLDERLARDLLAMPIALPEQGAKSGTPASGLAECPAPAQAGRPRCPRLQGRHRRRRGAGGAHRQGCREDAFGVLRRPA
ncbi:ImpA family type VI secretion system protein [Azospirillum melinis]|uniref:type VI secretion system protein TssA n=1 Tax=Azospirillum melinis TaxID=328839 RepID=UPI003756B38B